VKKINHLWIVRIIWRDACISFSKDSETEGPGETQMSIGILLPKIYRDSYGKQYFRLLQNYGERQDDYTDVPRSWVVELKKLVLTPFQHVKIETIIRMPIKHGKKRFT